MRYQVSGANSVALDGTAVLTGQALLGGTIGTGRAFWLRSMWINNNATGVLALKLLDAAVGATDATSNRRVLIPGATNATATSTRTQVNFPPPGLKFSTNCVVLKDVTDVSSGGGIGTVGGSGFEE